MNKQAFARKLGIMEEGASDEVIKAAALAKMEEARHDMLEEDDAEGKFAKHAADLQEMASHYEEAYGDEAMMDGEEKPHVVMRKLAAKLAKLGDPAFGGKETPSEEAAEGHKMEGEDEGAKEEMTQFARRLGVVLPKNATRAQMMDALSASAVPTSQIPALIESHVKKALQAAEEKRNQAEISARARELVTFAIDNGYPREQEGALLKFASNPATFAAAEGIVKPFLKGDQLMSRMTSGGSPIGGSFDSRTEVLGGIDNRVVRMEALQTNATVFGEKWSKAVTELADSVEPKLSVKVEREMLEGTKGTKYESFERYQAAERILRKERPDLWKAAQES